MTTIDPEGYMKRLNTSQDLILSFTSGEEIIQFNRECERLTGYLRDEVLHRKFSDILLPKESLEYWKTLLESLRQTMSIDEFTLPIKTKQNQTYVVSWSGFFVKDANGSINDICLFGKLLKTNEETRQSVGTIIAARTQSEEQRTRLPSVELNPEAQSITMQEKQKKEKIVFAREKEADSEIIKTTLQNDFIESLETMEKNVENTSKKLDIMNKSIKELTRKYDSVTKRLGELEKKDRRLEKNHKNLGKHMQLLEEGYRRPARKQKEMDPKNMSFAEQPLQRKEFTFFSDPFGFKRQHRELDTQIKRIESRTRELDTFETQLMTERKTFNVRVEEFYRWREKLELLESAIEKRRQELMKQEDVLLERAPSIAQETVSPDLEIAKITEPAPPDYHELLNRIPQSAAIIQRGILKQINSSFAALIGYAVDEMVEKSFFDFIAFEGLADIEKYYLDRLKGESVSAYKTVFSGKNTNRIPVEVSVKSTMYNGEKAEIAIFTSLEKPESQTMGKQTA